MSCEIIPIDAARYEPHALHRGERSWLETNCYVDLWIEVLHAFGYDPVASLAFTVALDFEADQWLFFKQPTGELYDLYGVDVQELNIWRNLLDHTVEQVTLKRLVMIEMDAFYLPDTAGVSYRSAHTKSTVGVQSIDPKARTLGYFHNAGYFTLGPEDFSSLFGLDRERRPEELVPYTEFAKLRVNPGGSQAALVEKSLGLLRKHLARRPRDNPFGRFRARFSGDLAWLCSQPTEMFHLYAFASLRQCGACFELASSYLSWLGAHGQPGFEPAQKAFETIAVQSKTLQFKAARAVVLKRPADLSPMLDAMHEAWQVGMDALETRLS